MNKDTLLTNLMYIRKYLVERRRDDFSDDKWEDYVKYLDYIIYLDYVIYRIDVDVWKCDDCDEKKQNTSMTRADILDAAKKCVCGQREQDYGTPESNFKLIADLWNDYLFPSLNENKNVISPTDVAMMMALLKIARIRNGGGTGDSFVDLAGYAACGGEINGRT